MTDGVRAVVVNYNAGHHLVACVDSLVADGVTDIVVVDNASADGSKGALAAAHPDVTWMDAGGNLGYGRAANLGATGSDADVLVCNPDLVIAEGAVAAMASRLAVDPGLGAVGPLIHNTDGTVYPSARTFPRMTDAVGHGVFGLIAPNNPFTRRYRLLDWDHREPRVVDWVSGACVLVRRRAWEQISGFDPGYFMYMEDVDLCWRLGRRGWAVAFEPAAEVTHVQGASTKLHPYRMLAFHHLSLWRFARRTSTGRRRLALPFVALGLAGRFAAACAGHRVGTRQPTVPATES